MSIIRKPLLSTLKTGLACSMYLFPFQESVLLQGAGSVKKLPSLIKAKGIRKPLIVTDPFLMQINLLAGLFAEFEAIGMPYAVLVTCHQNTYPLFNKDFSLEITNVTGGLLMVLNPFSDVIV